MISGGGSERDAGEVIKKVKFKTEKENQVIKKREVISQHLLSKVVIRNIRRYLISL